MFTITTRNYQIFVGFADQVRINSRRIGTYCYITVFTKSDVLVAWGFGEAKLNPVDVYDKYVGHRLAFARAVQSIAPRRYLRAREKLWEAFAWAHIFSNGGRIIY